MKVCIMKDNRSSVYEEEGKPYQTLQEASKQKSSLSAENRQLAETADDLENGCFGASGQREITWKLQY